MFTLGEAGLREAVKTLYAGRRPRVAIRGCDGKTKFKSKGAAEAAIRSLVKRDLCNQARIHAYYCGRHCCWHTGHAREAVKEAA